MNYKRYATREVLIGDLPLGGANPIRIQSMTTKDTMDTEATVEECIRIIESGCELVRITAPSKKEAENLKFIREELSHHGYTQPLVADIHFTPNAAEIAARLIEKVRINPGNFADKKKFETLEYTDEEYEAELTRIREKFIPLIDICKEHGTAMRVGTNHGSLSDRIMSRYGDTPRGMVESAMEFLRICQEQDFHQIVLSMKASNAQVMVQAYRLLAKTMEEEGMNYPLHLGVTEAGDGEDGRIKSAVGIGTLLEEGLGDTIRVSLTEDPEFEAPVAKMLADRYTDRAGHTPIPEVQSSPIDPFSYSRRQTHELNNLGDHQVPRVICDLSHIESLQPANLFGAGYNYSVPLDKWNIQDMAADYIFCGDHLPSFGLPGTLGVILNASSWNNSITDQAYPLFTWNEYQDASEKHSALNFVQVDLEAILSESFQIDSTVCLILNTSNSHGMMEQKRAFIELINLGISNPVIIHRAYSDLEEDAFQLYASTDAGALLIDGLGDGIWLQAPNISLQKLTSVSFGILQATRTRISKTEYISCPSCGRTLFDLQETTAKIRSRTAHLKGVKIGIMGCIVNGPGEMADADYGYVGSGVDKITLYKNKEVVRRAVPAVEAVDALIDLIKEHGDWVEVPAAEEPA